MRNVQVRGSDLATYVGMVETCVLTPRSCISYPATLLEMCAENVLAIPTVLRISTLATRSSADEVAKPFESWKLMGIAVHSMEELIRILWYSGSAQQKDCMLASHPG